MRQDTTHLVVLGGGTFGTSLGAALAKAGNRVTLIVRDQSVAESINIRRVNEKYLPDAKLPRDLKASCAMEDVSTAGMVFLAVPSRSILETAATIRPILQTRACVINLAKGLHEETLTLDRALANELPGVVIGSLKGPNFARPLLHGAPTGMTLALSDLTRSKEVLQVFEGSNVSVEAHLDLSGVEFVAAVKNVFAVVMGICDAIEDNPNTRFMILSKIIAECHRLLIHFGFDPSVMFTYAGLGDMLMTSLNDTSRNRTLGLLIGRGFNFVTQGAGPVTEGKKATRLLTQHTIATAGHFPIIHGLDEVFEGKKSPQEYFKSLAKG